jgi:hypothetical protein
MKGRFNFTNCFLWMRNFVIHIKERTKVFENGMLEGKFGPRREKVRDCGKLHEKLHNLFSQNIIGIMKSGRHCGEGDIGRRGELRN